MYGLVSDLPRVHCCSEMEGGCAESVEGEGKKILESYGAPYLPHSPLGPAPSSYSLLSRRHSDPILLPSAVESDTIEKDWPTLFGGTPVEEENLPQSRPRSRTVHSFPNGTLPSVREKSKTVMAIGQKKSKLPPRRMSLPPILEADHHVEPLPPVSKNPAPSDIASSIPNSKKFFRWGKKKSEE